MFSPLSPFFSICLALFLSLTHLQYLSFMSLFSHACQFTHFTLFLLFIYLFFCLLFIHLPLWPSLCLPAHIYALHPFPLSLFMLFFPPICTPITITTTTTTFCTMPKQPSECHWLLGYPTAIVIGSHYSWDLPFNPGYVIGLLSSVQAGLTPQTSMHLAMMQCYHVLTSTAS